MGFPDGSDGKESACSAGDPSLIPGLGRSPGEGNGNPLQYSCLENPMDRGAWRATVHRVAKSRTRLRNFTFTFTQVAVYFHKLNFLSEKNIVALLMVIQGLKTLPMLYNYMYTGKKTNFKCYYYML